MHEHVKTSWCSTRDHGGINFLSIGGGYGDSASSKIAPTLLKLSQCIIHEYLKLEFSQHPWIEVIEW
ncbi:hypothetical protein M404DRAFT_998025 [Pisolithus tinctorius Marx 270]|uniref:Uncharacterized protein n=1 Tax=Pisolithus tinctorius Marx 270 TaxID=870435 RepID=A0A0C3KE41_PISTI|nr:hypothetical protein M404DRAFT_998025 [Pisolithus tinctorius Marx 270]